MLVSILFMISVLITILLKFHKKQLKKKWLNLALPKCKLR